MENIILTGKICNFFGVFLAVSLLVIAAIILDLWDGVYTARVTRQRIHSHRLRVTISKVSEYWRFVMIGFLVDCIGSLFDFYILPFVAVLFGAGLIVVEAKSMFEHAQRRKSQTSDLPDIIRRIVACAKETEAEDIILRLTGNVNKTETNQSGQ